MVQDSGRVIPIEVKAEENVKSKSLKTYIEKHPDLRSIRISLLPYRREKWMENLPLYIISSEFYNKIPESM